jgi:hypothetical protein
LNRCSLLSGDDSLACSFRNVTHSHGAENPPTTNLDSGYRQSNPLGSYHSMSTPVFGNLLDAMKRAAAALRDHDIPFVLAGSLAVYARGGPETDHDVDFVLAPRDADRALEVLSTAGFRSRIPPSAGSTRCSTRTTR